MDRIVSAVAGLLDNIELGLELLSVYESWEWTMCQLDRLFLPAIGRLSLSMSSSSSAQQQSTDDSELAVARAMLGIIGDSHLLSRQFVVCLAAFQKFA